MNENKAVIVGLTLAASCPLSADANQQANPLSLDRRTRMEIKVDQSLQSSFVRYLEVNGRIQVTDRLRELKQLPPISGIIGSPHATSPVERMLIDINKKY